MYHVIETGPARQDGTGRQVTQVAGPFGGPAGAIATARERLADLPARLVEAGFTVIVEDDAGRQVWGVTPR